ncbi:hypothetical protein, partial [Blastococcus sp. SYSU DS0617]
YRAALAGVGAARAIPAGRTWVGGTAAAPAGPTPRSVRAGAGEVVTDIGFLRFSGRGALRTD